MKFKIHLVDGGWITHDTDTCDSVEDFVGFFSGSRFVNLIADNGTVSVNVDNIIYIEESD